ncbi:hypothetical protein CSKR_106505, partial [Clonorchis sinensis]
MIALNGTSGVTSMQAATSVYPDGHFQTFDQSDLGLMPDRKRPEFLANLAWDRLFGRCSTRLRA